MNAGPGDGRWRPWRSLSSLWGVRVIDRARCRLSSIGSVTESAPSASSISSPVATSAGSPTDAASADPNLTRAVLKLVGHPPTNTDGGTWGVEQLTAVSKDEVWASVAFQWFRFRDGTWQPVGIGSECSPVPASDGAVWIVTSEGLTRVEGDRSRVVAPDVRAGRFTECPQLLAGPAGSIWLNLVGDGWSDDLAESAEVVQYQIDGARKSIGKPSTMEEVCLEAAGIDGSVWVSQWWLNPNNDTAGLQPTEGWLRPLGCPQVDPSCTTRRHTADLQRPRKRRRHR